MCEVRGLNQEKFNLPKYILTLVTVLTIKATLGPLKMGGYNQELEKKCLNQQVFQIFHKIRYRQKNSF